MERGDCQVIEGGAASIVVAIQAIKGKFDMSSKVEDESSMELLLN